METKINLDFIPSLEHISLVKLAVILWNLDDFDTEILEFSFDGLSKSYQRHQWRGLEKKVMKKVQGLELTETLKKKLVDIIKPIGIEILQAKEYRVDSYKVKLQPNKLRWTPYGTVDKKKTVEELIKDKSLDISYRYTMACVYCLEANVSTLWKKMSKIRRNDFYNADLGKVEQDILVIFWTLRMKDKVERLRSLIEHSSQNNHKIRLYHFVYLQAMQNANKEATEWFMRKLTREEIAESFLSYVNFLKIANCRCRALMCSEHYSDVLCFLLSKMNGEQQAKVISMCPGQALLCFLEWPRQRFFLEVASRAWDFLSNEDYCHLLKKMIALHEEGRRDYDYRMLFGEFWKQGSNSNKSYILRKCTTESLLSELISLKEEAFVRLIVKDATPEEKKTIISHERGQNLCISMLYDGKWNLLAFFIRECILSEEDAVLFKYNFKKCRSREEIALKRGYWDQFFKLIDNLFCTNGEKRKRCYSNPAERNDRGKSAELIHKGEKNGSKSFGNRDRSHSF